MSIFELTAIVSPLAGAIAGGTAVKAPGFGWQTLGAGIGLAIGLLLFFASFGLSALLGRYCDAEKLNTAQWLASLTAVLVVAAAPFVTWPLSVFVISEVFHL